MHVCHSRCSVQAFNLKKAAQQHLLEILDNNTTPHFIFISTWCKMNHTSNLPVWRAAETYVKLNHKLSEPGLACCSIIASILFKWALSRDNAIMAWNEVNVTIPKTGLKGISFVNFGKVSSLLLIYTMQWGKLTRETQKTRLKLSNDSLF